MAFALQFVANFSEVVNFSVVRDPHRTVLIRHWHVAGCREVENRQAAAAKTNVGAVGAAIVPEATIIGAPVRLDGSHVCQYLAISPVDQPADATHNYATFIS